MNTSQIATVASGIIQLINTGQVIYRVAANAMDAIEQGQLLSGADKKAWVLRYVESVVKDLGENWGEYSEKIIQFIDQLKTAYNAVKSLFN